MPAPREAVALLEAMETTFCRALASRLGSVGDAAFPGEPMLTAWARMLKEARWPPKLSPRATAALVAQGVTAGSLAASIRAEGPDATWRTLLETLARAGVPRGGGPTPARLRGWWGVLLWFTLGQNTPPWLVAEVLEITRVWSRLPEDSELLGRPVWEQTTTVAASAVPSDGFSGTLHERIARGDAEAIAEARGLLDQAEARARGTERETPDIPPGATLVRLIAPGFAPRAATGERPTVDDVRRYEREVHKALREGARGAAQSLAMRADAQHRQPAAAREREAVGRRHVRWFVEYAITGRSAYAIAAREGLDARSTVIRGIRDAAAALGLEVPERRPGRRPAPGRHAHASTASATWDTVGALVLRAWPLLELADWMRGRRDIPDDAARGPRSRSRRPTER